VHATKYYGIRIPPQVSENPAARASLREYFWRHATLSVVPSVAASTPCRAPSKHATAEGGGGGGGGGGGASGGGKTGAVSGATTSRPSSGTARDNASSARDDAVSSLIGLSVRASSLPAHRVLAINRYEARKAIRVTVGVRLSTNGSA
jgi:hypothetical protein